MQVPLEKGYSQVDWMRLSRAVQPPPPRKDITMAEVKQHKTPEDAWMVFRNRVGSKGCDGHSHHAVIGFVVCQ
jgi:cytochrome-b5 reductase